MRQAGGAIRSDPDHHSCCYTAGLDGRATLRATSPGDRAATGAADLRAANGLTGQDPRLQVLPHRPRHGRRRQLEQAFPAHTLIDFRPGAIGPRHLHDLTGMLRIDFEPTSDLSPEGAV